MAYEIDFLPVGDDERSGDAIAMRFGNLTNPNAQTVVVIDGGTKESGAALVEHIKKYYNTDVVDSVVCTHSDSDHVSGLTEVLENLTVRRLFMHLPWNHVADLEEQLTKASPTDDVRQHFKKSLETAHELERLATKKGVPVYELFSDKSERNAVFTVLGPSSTFYEGLLQSFRCAEELNLQQLIEKVMATVERAAEKAVKWISETWDSERLVEPKNEECSAENNSSVILLFTQGDRKFLFTSDAGVLALTEAAKFAESIGIDLSTLTALQVPHHGSKHNVGPAILDRIVGTKVSQLSMPTKTAIVSAAKEAPKHPSKRVVNALMRRGAKVIATQGNGIVHRSEDAPDRGWPNAVGLPFYPSVEE